MKKPPEPQSGDRFCSEATPLEDSPSSGNPPFCSTKFLLGTESQALNPWSPEHHRSPLPSHLSSTEQPFPADPRHPCGTTPRLLLGTMSRSYKIALILKSKSSLPVYKDLAKLSDRELDEQV